MSVPNTPDAENAKANATRRRLLTGTAVGLAALTGSNAAGLWRAAPAEATSTGTDWTVLTPSNNTSGGPDTTNINNALQVSYNAIHTNPANPPAVGPVVYLSAGTYYTNAPIVVPEGVSLRGPIGATQSAGGVGNLWSAVIVPVSGWQPTNTLVNTSPHPDFPVPGAGVITMINFASNGASTTAASRMDVRDLWINGSGVTNPPAGVDAIAAYGPMTAVNIERVGIDKATGNGIGLYLNKSNDFPQGWLFDTVLIQTAAWAQASTGYTAAFAKPYSTIKAGVYYVGVVIGVGSPGQMPTFTGALPLAKGVAALTGLSPQTPAYSGSSSTGLGSLPATGTTMAGITTNGEYVFYATLA